MLHQFYTFLVHSVTPAAAAYTMATASDVGFLQAKSNVACYYPNPNIAEYAGATCTNALLSGALQNHLNLRMHSEAPSTAYYNIRLDFLGDYSWHVPSSMDGSQVIACHQGALSLRDKHGNPLFHTWCHFVTEDNQFSFSAARDNGNVCSRIHISGPRAERDGCVSKSENMLQDLGVWMTVSALSLAGLALLWI